MANTVKETYSQNTSVFRYTVSMRFIHDGEVFNIENNRIRSIAIDYNYKEMNMPMIFLTAVLEDQLAERMDRNQDSGTIIFELKRANVSSDMPNLYTNYISDKFIYFININDGGKEYSAEEDVNRTVTIGLLSLDCVNKNKKHLNGVINGNLSSLMYYITGHIPVVLEPPRKNINFVNQFLPPMNSVAKSIEYINNLATFYDTPYRFFIDFDCAYLISSSGKGITKKGEEINTVMINLRQTYNTESKQQGMTMNEARTMYQIEIDDEEDCEISDNHFSEKIYSKVTAVNASGQSFNKSIRTSEDSNVNAKNRFIRIMNDNEGILDNTVSSINSSAIQIMVQKADIDASVLTLNKEYIINAKEVRNNDIYNGRYLLARKRELYIRQDEEFIANVMLLFDKAPY